MAKKQKEHEQQSVYTFTHTYDAKVTHEVKYTLPSGLDDDAALEYVRAHDIHPDSTEAVDEDYEGNIDEWTLDSEEPAARP